MWSYLFRPTTNILLYMTACYDKGEAWATTLWGKNLSPPTPRLSSHRNWKMEVDRSQDFKAFKKQLCAFFSLSDDKVEISTSLPIALFILARILIFAAPLLCLLFCAVHKGVIIRKENYNQGSMLEEGATFQVIGQSDGEWRREQQAQQDRPQCGIPVCIISWKVALRIETI